MFFTFFEYLFAYLCLIYNSQVCMCSIEHYFCKFQKGLHKKHRGKVEWGCMPGTSTTYLCLEIIRNFQELFLTLSKNLFLQIAKNRKLCSKSSLNFEIVVQLSIFLTYKIECCLKPSNYIFV